MSLDLSVSNELITVLDYLFEKFGVVVDWSNGELLPYIKSLADKIVNYKEGIAWLWIAVAVVCFIAGIVSFIVAHVQCEGGWTFLGIILLGAAVTIIIVNSYTLIACNTFPEKVVLEYIEQIMINNGAT